LEQVGAARPEKYCFFNTLLHTLRPKECTLSAFKSFSAEHSLLLHHALKEPRIPSVKMPEAYLMAQTYRPPNRNSIFPASAAIPAFSPATATPSPLSSPFST